MSNHTGGEERKISFRKGFLQKQFPVSEYKKLVEQILTLRCKRAVDEIHISYRRKRP